MNCPTHASFHYDHLRADDVPCGKMLLTVLLLLLLLSH